MTLDEYLRHHFIHLHYLLKQFEMSLFVWSITKDIRVNTRMDDRK